MTDHKITVILVGFQYINNFDYMQNLDNTSLSSLQQHIGISLNRSNNTPTILPGILIDLYQAYHFIQKIQYDKLYIVTDIEQDQKWRETIGAMGKYLVDSNVLDFIETIKKDGDYFRYRNRIWFTDLIKDACTNCNRLLFYYTGHGKNGFLEMPPQVDDQYALEIENSHQYGTTTLSYQSCSVDGSVHDISETVFKNDNFANRLEQPTFRSKRCKPKRRRSRKSALPIDGLNFNYGSFVAGPGILEQSAKFGHDDTILSFMIETKSVESNCQYSLTDTDSFVDYVSLDDLRDIIFGSCKSDCQIFMVFDCCNGTGLELPWKMSQNGIYKLAHNQLVNIVTTDHGQQIVETQPVFYRPDVVCWSSTTQSESSLSTADGSLFTQHLFTMLEHGCRSVRDIISYVSKQCEPYTQTSTVHVTYPDRHQLWSWLYGGELTFITEVKSSDLVLVLTPVQLEEKSTSSTMNIRCSDSYFSMS